MHDSITFLVMVTPTSIEKTFWKVQASFQLTFDYSLQKIIVFHIIFCHCSFDQLKMSNHSDSKSVVSIMYEQNIICSKMQLDSIALGQTIISRQLFADHMVFSRPMI